MRARWIAGVLAVLVIFDCTLVTVAAFLPQLWFDIFHGVAYRDPQGFLYRCAANWAAFALFQAIALLRWRRQPHWLLVVAGVRFSDIFTDLVYYFAAADRTWFASSLLAMGPINLALGLFFAKAWKAQAHESSEAL